MNPVTYFEIPVQDLDRAVRFYEKVFDVKLERGSIHGNDMAFFPAFPDQPGITGSLARGDSYVPGKQGTRVYFNTANIEQTLQLVSDIGGSVLFPKTSVGESGWVAEFEDSEGNCIALCSKG
ncbi:MAG: VOC family protein [Planctomycetota bacterium]